MGLFGLFSHHEILCAVDIGATSVKLLQLDMSGDRPRIEHWGHSQLSGDIFTNHVLSRPDIVAQELIEQTEKNKITTKFGATCIPGPSVFTKKIKMPTVERDELSSMIQLEAGNFIPHKLDAVKLDYHVIGTSGRNQLDVLVAAAKTEVIDSFLDALLSAGIEPLVMDVDYFSLQNAFELNYPELKEKTVALVNIGARYTAVNICRNGESLFTGDISTGGRSMTEGIASTAGISVADAEEKKRTVKVMDSGPLADAVKAQVDTVAVELNRQLSFFWNASGSEDGFDQILLGGGGALIAGLSEAVAHRTGIPTALFDPFRGIDCSEAENQVEIKRLAPAMAIAVGLAIRQPGDKIFPDDL